MSDPNQPRPDEDIRYPQRHGKGRSAKSKSERRRRQELFNAQDGLCHWCRLPMQMNPMRRTPNGNLKDNPLFASFEHLIPKSMGGPRGKWRNVVLAHANCNNKRSRRRFEHDPVYGEVAERSIASVLKTDDDESHP